MPLLSFPLAYMIYKPTSHLDAGNLKAIHWNIGIQVLHSTVNFHWVMAVYIKQQTGNKRMYVLDCFLGVERTALWHLIYTSRHFLPSDKYTKSLMQTKRINSRCDVTFWVHGFYLTIADSSIKCKPLLINKSFYDNIYKKKGYKQR